MINLVINRYKLFISFIRMPKKQYRSINPVHGGMGDQTEVFMDNLMKMEDREIRPGNIRGNPEKIQEFRERISDESYLDHAISKIATDLSHYLTKDK